MNDSQLLSAFQELTPRTAQARPPEPVLLFDTCQVGVVLRAILFVEGVMAVGAMFGASSVAAWLERLALLSAAALAATLGWLLVACSSKRLLARLPTALQPVCGVLLGALAGVYGCAILLVVAPASQLPWFASACAGALLSAMVVAVLVLRAMAEWRRDLELDNQPAPPPGPGGAPPTAP